MNRVRPVALAALVVFGACSSDEDSLDSTAVADATASGGSEGASTGGDPEMDGGEMGGGIPQALHRLTEVQLHATLRDLFAVDRFEPISLPDEIPLHGFSNNAALRAPTPLLVESLQRDFMRFTRDVLQRPKLAWLDCNSSGGDDPSGCGRASLLRLAKRAWRRPLSDEEKGWVVQHFDRWHASLGFRPALELTIQMLLQSPDFLYLIEPSAEDPAAEIDDFQLASRLSYFLWNSMPDAELFMAADRGELRQPEVLRGQARRMIHDLRSRNTVLDFHRQWLSIHEVASISVDPETYFPESDHEEIEPGIFMAQYRLGAEREFEYLVKASVYGDGTLSSLLTRRDTWATAAMAELYGAKIDREAGVEFYSNVGVDGVEYTMYPARLPPHERQGFLTSAAFLATNAHPVHPSPVERGVFVLERLLCRPPPKPPDDVPPLEEDGDELPKTNRDRYAQHSKNPACAGCHQSIDGIGFTFENYDSLGGFRESEGRYPIDASGELLGTDVDGPVGNAMELIDRLATSRAVHDCVVRQWYRYATHRSETPADDPWIAALAERFWQDGGKIPNLLVDIVSSDVFSSPRKAAGH